MSQLDAVSRFEGMLIAGFLAIDENSVNIDDVVHCWPGGIVRVDGNPRDALRVVVMPQDECLGCVAGLISEDE